MKTWSLQKVGSVGRSKSLGAGLWKPRLLTRAVFLLTGPQEEATTMDMAALAAMEELKSLCDCEPKPIFVQCHFCQASPHG